MMHHLADPRVRRTILALEVSFSILLFGGCSRHDVQDEWSSRRPKVVPSGGVVSYRSQPVEGATVTFMNPQTNVCGTGTTDAQGKFQLTTYEHADGVTPGPQKVAIRKVQVINKGKPGVDYSTSVEPAPPPEIRWLLPERYSDFDNSGLTVEVTGNGTNEFTFDLKDE